MPNGLRPTASAVSPPAPSAANGPAATTRSSLSRPAAGRPHGSGQRHGGLGRSRLQTPRDYAPALRSRYRVPGRFRPACLLLPRSMAELALPHLGRPVLEQEMFVSRATCETVLRWRWTAHRPACASRSGRCSPGGTTTRCTGRILAFAFDGVGARRQCRVAAVCGRAGRRRH